MGIETTTVTFTGRITVQRTTAVCTVLRAKKDLVSQGKVIFTAGEETKCIDLPHRKLTGNGLGLDEDWEFPMSNFEIVRTEESHHDRVLRWEGE